MAIRNVWLAADQQDNTTVSSADNKRMYTSIEKPEIIESDSTDFYWFPIESLSVNADWVDSCRAAYFTS
jgi:hypothetical protein